MRSTHKRYLLIFILGFIAIRTPGFIGPRFGTYWLHKLIEEAQKHNFSISIHNYSFDSVNTLHAERVLIEDLSKPQMKYIIDSLNIQILGIINPSMQLSARLYEGSIQCNLSSVGVISLFRSGRAHVACDVKSVQLQSFPLTGNYNILGILDASVESELDKNPKNVTIKGEVKIIDGYLDLPNSFCNPSKLISVPDNLKLACMTVSKFPPFVNVELFTSLEYMQNKIVLTAANARSNYGLFMTKGIITSETDSFQKPEIDINGTFTLSSISKELLEPWIALIQNGKRLESDNGAFTVKGSVLQPRVTIQ